MGNNATAKGNRATAAGADASATGDKSTAIGQNANAKAKNSVALGSDSVADEDNTISVGSKGNERRVTNVARGVKPTDAVNKAQLDEVKGDVGQIRKDLRKTDRKLRAGIAGAVAVANIPQVTKAGGTMVGAGVGNYNGQSAVAVGFSRLSDNNRVIIKGSAGATTQGDFNVGAGIGYQW
ncbi:YadA family autotransporter adhesin [Actinobacillus equuli]|nr:YadA-like family protein [Actinobacillus equuli]WGE43956.1 YadA-like family protein [Actinobacillus equuli subsp. equuli]WGE64864.1 YadA-like family protein [Actinobacillus equuli subsp. equuli]WGE78839.1 YadA-like family protein [Actinobacillus equuli subsp. equuli]